MNMAAIRGCYDLFASDSRLETYMALAALLVLVGPTAYSYFRGSD